MSDYRTDRPYWCESCARQKDCYGITLRPKCFVPIADRKTEPTAYADGYADGQRDERERWERMADRKTENSSGKPNNYEVKNYCDDCLYTDICDSKEFFYACTSKATISKMEQVEDEPLTCSFSDCDNFKNPDYARCIECKRKQIELKTEPTISKMEQVDKTQTDCVWK